MANKKAEVVRRILRQETYLEGSATYRKAHDSLMRLSQDALNALDIILVFKVTESNELTRQVDRILGKS